MMFAARVLLGIAGTGSILVLLGLTARSIWLPDPLPAPAVTFVAAVAIITILALGASGIAAIWGVVLK